MNQSQIGKNLTILQISYLESQTHLRGCSEGLPALVSNEKWLP